MKEVEWGGRGGGAFSPPFPLSPPPPSSAAAMTFARGGSVKSMGTPLQHHGLCHIESSART